LCRRGGPAGGFSDRVVRPVDVPADQSADRHCARDALMLACTAALAFSMMMGARPLDPDAPNDIDVYYEVYREVAAGRLDAFGTFGGGLEVALPLLCGLWALILPPLTVNGLMFCLRVDELGRCWWPGSRSPSIAIADGGIPR
jgi:hypothetical protein